MAKQKTVKPIETNEIDERNAQTAALVEMAADADIIEGENDPDQVAWNGVLDRDDTPDRDLYMVGRDDPP